MPPGYLGDRWAKTQVLPVTCGQCEENQLGPIMRKAPRAGDERGSLTGSLPRPKDVIPTQIKDETQHWRALSLPGSPVQVDKRHTAVGRVEAERGAGAKVRSREKQQKAKTKETEANHHATTIQTSSIPAKSEPGKITEE